MFHTILTHRRTHLDEICAILMLKMCGEKQFPGIGNAKVVFEGAGGEEVHGCSAEDWESQGVVCIGVGGGRFDEHPGPGVPKKNGECASTLVAKALGIDNDPAWEKILQFVKNSDLKASGGPFDLAQMIKAAHQAYPNDPQKVFEWALFGLEVKYKEQQVFLAAIREIKESSTEEKVHLSDGTALVMVTAVTENENFSKAARSKGAAIVIQQQSSGNVQIFIDKRFRGLTLCGIAAILRREEAKANERIITTDSQTLRSEGKVAGAEEWFYHKPGEFLLNGSSTTPNNPTKLTLDQIKEIVRNEVGHL